MGCPGNRDYGPQAGHFSGSSLRPHRARENRKGTGENKKSSWDASPKAALDPLTLKWPNLTRLFQTGLRWPDLSFPLWSLMWSTMRGRKTLAMQVLAAETISEKPSLWSTPRSWVRTHHREICEVCSWASIAKTPSDNKINEMYWPSKQGFTTERGGHSEELYQGINNASWGIKIIVTNYDLSDHPGECSSLLVSFWLRDEAVQCFWISWLLCPQNYPSRNTGAGCHFLLQGLFPTQGWNSSLLCLFIGRWVLYHCTYSEAPIVNCTEDAGHGSRCVKAWLTLTSPLPRWLTPRPGTWVMGIGCVPLHRPTVRPHSMATPFPQRMRSHRGEPEPLHLCWPHLESHTRSCQQYPTSCSGRANPHWERATEEGESREMRLTGEGLPGSSGWESVLPLQEEQLDPSWGTEILCVVQHGQKTHK